MPRVPTSLWFAATLLSVMSAAAAEGQEPASLRPVVLEVSVNGQKSPDSQLILEDGEGGIYANTATLREWRIRLPQAAPIAFEGEAWYRLDRIATLRLRLSTEKQMLAIDAEAEAFEPQTSQLAPSAAMAMTPAARGGYLNYDLLFEHAGGRTSVNGAIDAGFALAGGALTTSVVGGADGRSRTLVRLESAWTLDRPATLTSLRIGDSISSSGPGGVPVRFGGIQFGRNFAVQPGFLTMPLPTYDGSATLPGVVDVYVNNVLQASREIGPGPFQLNDIPVHSGGGNVAIVTRDLLGRETVSEQSYYASSVMLRRGLHDFSYEAGLIRRSFGRRSHDYGAPIASTTHRYGLTDTITIEGHLQASGRTRMGGIAATFALGNIGITGVTASVSQSRRGTGYRLAGSFERRTMGLSIGARTEIGSPNYAFVGLAEREQLPRRIVQVFADLPFAGGAIGANLLARDFDDQPDERLASLFLNQRVGKAISLQLYARRAIIGERQTVFGLHATLLLGGQRSASASIEAKRNASLGRVSYQSDPPAGEGGGYRVAATAGAIESADAVYTRNLRSTVLGAHLSQVHGRTGIRLSAAGSVGMAGGRLFASRAIGSSFAAVEVGDFAGVKVYADNQLVGVTDGKGKAMIPSLRAFERNVIRIDESDLPLDVQLASSEVAIRPYARTPTLISFAARQAHGVLMQVRLDDGRPLPAGATVTLVGSDRAFVTASGGEVYIEDLTGTAGLTARWNGGSCSFTAVIPETGDPQPRLENLVCNRAPTYAQH